MIKNLFNKFKNSRKNSNLEKISIIIPAYNVSKYIDRCLKSVRKQTYKNLEIICINDGSTDDTLDKLNKHAKDDNRIILMNTQHMGVSATRNLGLKIATGEYLGFVDSDDYIDLSMYEILHSIIKKEDTDLAVCGFKRVYEDFAHRKASDEFYDNKSLFQHGKQDISNEVIACFMITLWSKLYKRSIIKDYNISFENGLIFEDWIFYWEYLTHSRSLYFLEDKLYSYCQHENSIMASIYENPKGGVDSTLDYMLTAEIIYKNLMKNNLFEKYEQAFWRGYAHIYKNAYYFINDAKKLEVKNKAADFLKNFNLNKHKEYMNSDDYKLLSDFFSNQ